MNETCQRKEIKIDSLEDELKELVVENQKLSKEIMFLQEELDKSRKYDK